VPLFSSLGSSQVEGYAPAHEKGEAVLARTLEAD
jgi:hypothetical protein